MHGKKNHQKKDQKDYEMFLQDIEEDTEVRNQIDLYRVLIFIFLIFIYRMKTS